jgi:hypothetical protein
MSVFIINFPHQMDLSFLLPSILLPSLNAQAVFDLSFWLVTADRQVGTRTENVNSHLPFSLPRLSKSCL